MGQYTSEQILSTIFSEYIKDNRNRMYRISGVTDDAQRQVNQIRNALNEIVHYDAGENNYEKDENSTKALQDINDGLAFVEKLAYMTGYLDAIDEFYDELITMIPTNAPVDCVPEF